MWTLCSFDEWAIYRFSICLKTRLENESYHYFESGNPSFSKFTLQFPYHNRIFKPFSWQFRSGTNTHSMDGAKRKIPARLLICGFNSSAFLGVHHLGFNSDEFDHIIVTSLSWTKATKDCDFIWADAWHHWGPGWLTVSLSCQHLQYNGSVSLIHSCDCHVPLSKLNINLQNHELCSATTWTPPLESTYRELSFEWSHL